MTEKHFETPHILYDLPLDKSDMAHFHFDNFAATLARLIASKETRTPLPGAVWAAVRRELGDMWDVKLAMVDWAERK